MRRKVCVITGTRADYGLLRWPMRVIASDPRLELQVIACGMHLSHEFGYTVREIEADGFIINERVDMLVSGDSASATCKSIGLGVIGFSEAFRRLAPDIILILGDRFEMLSAAQTALIHAIPIAHIAGGDVTEGAFDESIRHSLTKMSHLHLVTNADSHRRIKQMGENPAHIFTVGSPGLDGLRRESLMSRSDLEKSLGVPLRQQNFVVTFHPVTLQPGSGVAQVRELLAALSRFGEETGLYITAANADPEGRAINNEIHTWAKDRAHVHFFSSLGHLRYLSLMRESDCVIGNSSSGLYEAPSFGVPTVNIGDRQLGRLKAPSVVDCEVSGEAIFAAIQKALALDTSNITNPYGDGNSSERIRDAILNFEFSQEGLRKPFYQINSADVLTKTE